MDGRYQSWAIFALAGLLFFPPIAGLSTSTASVPGIERSASLLTAPSLPQVSQGHAPAALLGWAHTPGHIRSLAPRNALVDAPCQSSSNAEVESAYDATNHILYDAWIGCNGIGFSRSLDGGASFQPAVTVLGSDNGSSWDPAIALSANGTVYVAYMRNDSTGDAPCLAWSWDLGRSFAGQSVAFLPNSHEFSDRDFIAVAPSGVVYLTWDYSPNPSIDVIGCSAVGSCYFTAGDYNIVLVYSSNGGKNWSNPVPVSTGYPNGGAPCGPLLVAPDGSINILWEGYAVNSTSHALGVGQNFFSRSSDGGAHFTAPVAVSNLTFLNSDWWINGAISRDNSGTLYATFDAQAATNDTAYVSVSRNQGVTWSSPLRLNPDGGPAPHIMAQSAGGENGTAYIAWMSNNSTQGWSTFERTLSGNGSSLSPPVVASAQFGVNGYWVGDTIGVSYLGTGRVAVSWTYAVSINGSLGPQIFSAVLGIPPPGAPTITGVSPGAGNATVTWVPPGTGGPVDGYEVAWGVEGQHAVTVNLSSSARSLALAPLLAGPHYVIQVAAGNLGGLGPFSSPALLTLTAWSLLSGEVAPSNSSVWFDTTPLALDASGTFSVNSTPGPHLVRAQASGFFPQSQAIDLAWNGSATIRISLLPEPGVVSGVIRPSNAHAAWDGTAVTLGFGGTYRLSAPGGSLHVFNVTAPGYIAVSRVVMIPGNATLWLNVSLVLVNAVLEFVILPSTANVTVNGTTVALDTSGRANVTLSPGSYSVEVTSEGFYPQFRNVTLGPTPLLVSVNLTAIPAGHNPKPGLGPLTSASPFLYVGIALVLVVVLLAASIWLGRRRAAQQLELVETGSAPDRLYPLRSEEWEDAPPGSPPPEP